MAMQAKPEEQKLEVTPRMRRTAMFNSALLSLNFITTTYLLLKTGNTVIGAMGAIAAVSCINDTLTFYYLKK